MVNKYGSYGRTYQEEIYTESKNTVHCCSINYDRRMFYLVAGYESAYLIGIADALCKIGN